MGYLGLQDARLAFPHSVVEIWSLNGKRRLSVPWLPDGRWVMRQRVVKISEPIPPAQQFATRKKRKRWAGVKKNDVVFPQPEGHTTLYCTLNFKLSNTTMDMICFSPMFWELFFVKGN